MVEVGFSHCRLLLNHFKHNQSNSIDHVTSFQTIICGVDYGDGCDS